MVLRDSFDATMISAKNLALDQLRQKVLEYSQKAQAEYTKARGMHGSNYVLGLELIRIRGWYTHQ